VSAAAAVTTTTTLTAAPAPAPVNATVTLTATVSAADGSSPAGTVQFETGSADIGSPVTVVNGVATTTATFATAGSAALSATFTPSSSSYGSSAGTDTETVSAYGGTVPVALTVPQSGTFTLTVTPGTVNLSVSGLTATGTLEDITVTDSRNYYPGWSISGQDSNFTGSGTTISGNQLGWAPVFVGSPEDGATLGGTVAPASPGLGTTAATLALAPPGCGFGTNVMSANLTLAIPSTSAAGSYSSTMTITAVTTGPQNEICASVPITVGG
jgi:hypothetical protein